MIQICAPFIEEGYIDGIDFTQIFNGKMLMDRMDDGYETKRSEREILMGY